MTDGAVVAPRGQDRTQPVGSGLRSPVWLWLAQGFLIALYGLAPAIVQQFLLSVLSDSLLWRRLGHLLRWMSYAVIAVAIIYALYHAYVVISARRRDTRDLQLTADLTAPGRKVELVERQEERNIAPDGEASEQGRRLLTGLWQFRDHELGIDAVLAVQAAFTEAPDRLPIPPPPDDVRAKQDTAVQVVQELLDREYFRLQDGCRLKISEEVTEDMIWSPPDEVSSYAHATAVPALLQHYADLSTRWARALDTRKLGAGAKRWFDTEEPVLYALVTSELEHKNRRAVVVELARIADALDSWYARTNQPERAKKVASCLFDLTDLHAEGADPTDEARERIGGTKRPTYPIVTELARIRGGGAGRIKCRPRKFGDALKARDTHQKAVRDFNDALRKQPRDGQVWKAIEKQLEEVWWLLPREDVAGEVSTLVNLAIVHLHQGRLDAAEDRLELAESLTRNDRDPDGRAHAFEIHGVVSWAQGKQRRAVPYWQRAHDLYSEIEDGLGAARCLQHLGSALMVMPSLGDLVVDQRVKLTDTAVKHQGDGWLKTAAEHLDESDLIDEYHRQAGTPDETQAADPLYPPRPHDPSTEPSGAQWLRRLLSDLPTGGKR